MQLEWECGTGSLRPCLHHREWASWASCGTCDASRQESLVKLCLLMESANRNTAQVLLLTLVKFALCLQMCPHSHEFLNISLRDFYREETPLVEAGLFWKDNISFV